MIKMIRFTKPKNFTNYQSTYIYKLNIWTPIYFLAKALAYLFFGIALALAAIPGVLFYVLEKITDKMEEKDLMRYFYMEKDKPK